MDAEMPKRGENERKSKEKGWPRWPKRPTTVTALTCSSKSSCSSLRSSLSASRNAAREASRSLSAFCFAAARHGQVSRTPSQMHSLLPPPAVLGGILLTRLCSSFASDDAFRRSANTFFAASISIALESLPADAEAVWLLTSLQHGGHLLVRRGVFEWVRR